MRKLFTLLIAALSLCGATSCSDNNDGIYVSASGEGSIVIGNNAPYYLYRMVFFNSLEGQEVYLMGSAAYVDADAQFVGRGAVVKLEMPADAETVDQVLQAQTFSIDGSDYTASYTSYVNYSAAEGEDDFISLESGTVIIRRSGSYYDIRLLGLNSDGENTLISYRGYIYRWFYSDQDEVTRMGEL